MAEYHILLTEEELKEVIHGLGMIIDRCCDYEEEEPTRILIEKIEKQKQSTADVAEVKHGEWEFAFDDWERRCSVCGKQHETTKYCPNCGAKMDVPDTDVGKKGDAYEKSKM